MSRGRFRSAPRGGPRPPGERIEPDHGARDPAERWRVLWELDLRTVLSACLKLKLAATCTSLPLVIEMIGRTS